MKYALTVIVLSSLVASARAQEEEKKPALTMSGYVDIYYGYDFNKPKSNTRPSFMYSYNRHNETNLNLGFVKGSYNSDNVRATLALMAGTYPNANLASEPGVLKNVFEANAGVKLSSRKNLWIDAGIFGSHIGFESAIGKDCWNLTRSMLADNTPYYEAGVKVSYTTDNGKWFLSALVLNGWQRIHRADGNSLPSFGTQVTFKPTDKITINSSTFMGTNSPDSARTMRYFHNFYSIFQVTEHVGVTVGVDCGVQDKRPDTSSKNVWWSPVVIAKIVITDKVALAMRGEYYDDRHGVIIVTGTSNGFRTTGASINLDYQIASNAVWRIEARKLISRDAVFEKGDGVSKSNTFVTTSLAVSF